jgi:hypothetical protein
LCSLATGTFAWAGSQVPRGLIGEAEAQEIFGRADEDPPNLKFFPQSVASGDPAPRGIVLWTRALIHSYIVGLVRENYYDPTPPELAPRTGSPEPASCAARRTSSSSPPAPATATGSRR